MEERNAHPGYREIRRPWGSDSLFPFRPTLPAVSGCDSLFGTAGVRHFTRDNFSFSTRYLVGQFIQPLEQSLNSRGIRLGEPEIRHLVDQIRIARGWKPRPRTMDEEDKKEAIGRHLPRES